MDLIEIVTRAKQGVTEPFICRASDNNIYFVKGGNATRKDLINEFICANLAGRYGLSIPDHEILWSDPDFISESSRFSPDFKELGSGFVFGSKRIDNCVDISFSNLEMLSIEDQLLCIFFDRWIRNSDRTLSAIGGNPNLLWRVPDARWFAIDHNLAFDKNVKDAYFWNQHIFSACLSDAGLIARLKPDLTERFERSNAILDQFIDAIPESWLFVDKACTIPTQYDFALLRHMLSAHRREEFWNVGEQGT